MVMTAKVNPKKIALVLAGVLLAIAFIAWLWPAGSSNSTPQQQIATNDDRVDYLASLGWNVTVTPAESMQVRIPDPMQDPVFQRYNDLQKSQGYDLTQYAGKTVMRYVYEITNYPDAQQPVYATILVYKNKIIGGDITDTAAKGAVQGLKKPDTTAPTEVPPVSSESSVPTE